MSNETCKNCKKQRTYKSSGTIRVKISNKHEGARASRIYFTPDSNYSVVDGKQRYAIFVPASGSKKKKCCKCSKRFYMCPLYACAHEDEVEFKYKGTLCKIADAAANNVKVELKVKLGECGCPTAKGREIIAITIPAKSSNAR